MEQKARQDYVDFRETARAYFSAPADQSALGLKGKVPADLQKFITAAHASYEAGKAAAYTATLLQYGYPPATLDAALTALDNLTNDSADQSSAEGAAQTATGTRDTAHKNLMSWMSKFRRIAKVALRGQPGLRTKLAL